MIPYIGYNFWAGERGMMLDEELVFKTDPNNTHLQKVMPWQPGDIFRATEKNGRVFLEKLGPLESIIINEFSNEKVKKDGAS
mgnify:CR=1 FL=1|jgi:hypothetical protein